MIRWKSRYAAGRHGHRHAGMAGVRLLHRVHRERADRVDAEAFDVLGHGGVLSRIPMAENFHCLVEIPKGSRNKYEWDEELQAIKLDRFLFASVVYPTDYGFIPQTLGEDGDPLDAMVVVTEPTFPGLHDPGEGHRAVPDARRQGRRRQGRVRPRARPELAPRREARGPERDAARRDLALLLDLQAARGDRGEGRRLVPARPGDRDHRGGQGALPRGGRWAARGRSAARRGDDDADAEDERLPATSGHGRRGHGGRRDRRRRRRQPASEDAADAKS